MEDQILIPGFNGTPGPWNVSISGTSIGPVNEHHVITPRVCEVLKIGKKSTRFANARLMAAAPGILHQLMEFHDHMIDQGVHDCEGIPGGCPVQMQIDAALIDKKTTSDGEQ